MLRGLNKLYGMQMVWFLDCEENALPQSYRAWVLYSYYYKELLP
jgi:hypothetical protein